METQIFVISLISLIFTSHVVCFFCDQRDH